MTVLYLPWSDNRIRTATLTSTNEDANFPRTRLQLPFGDRMFRFDTAAADMTLTADLGSALACTFSSLHFHNIDAGITSVVLSSDDNSGFSSPTTRATFTVASPTFFATFASASERYWRLTFNGTNGSAIYLAKWTLGVHSSLWRGPLPEWGEIREMPQTQQKGRRINRATHPPRRFELSFLYSTTAQKDEILALAEETAWGQEPLAIVPYDSEATVLFARLPNVLDFQRVNTAIRRFSLSIVEDDFPVVVT